MQIPASNLFADRLPRFVGNGRAEVDEEFTKSILRSPRLKSIPQKIEVTVHHPMVVDLEEGGGWGLAGLGDDCKLRRVSRRAGTAAAICKSG